MAPRQRDSILPCVHGRRRVSDNGSDGRDVLSAAQAIAGLVVSFALLAIGAADGAVRDPCAQCITITAGGTYSGSWTSNDSTPAVRISTAAPVTIVDSTITNRAGGTLVQSDLGLGTSITLKRVTANGGSGRFFVGENIQSLSVRNCTINKTGGIYVFKGQHAASIRITRNRQRNIQRGAEYHQFAQFNQVTTATIDVSWNEVINIYGRSEVEDNINIFKSSHAVVHDNYIQGAFPRYYTDSYSGSGIMVGDDGGSYNLVYDNQIVDATNVGIGIVGGHDNEVRNNRVVSDGKLDDGTSLMAANVGVVVWNAYSDTEWANNHAVGNVIAWVHAGPYRNDMWFPHSPSSDYALNKGLRVRVTHATELREHELWLRKLVTNRIQIGA